jgi:phospholipase D1/2
MCGAYESSSRRTLLIRAVALGLLVAALAAAGHFSGLSALSVDELRKWLRAASGFAPLLFIGLFLVLNTIGLPAPLLGAAAGISFGALAGAGVTLAAMIVTACAQFLLARHFGGERLRRRVTERLGRVGRLLERRGVLAIAGARLLPAPFSEFNVLAGLTPIRFRDFALGIVLGCAPKAVMWAGLATLLV